MADTAKYIDYTSRTDFRNVPDPDSAATILPKDYLYSKDSSNTLHLKTVPGILKFSSNVCGTDKKTGYIKKEFTPFVEELPSIMVPTNRIRQKIDMYVVVNLSLKPCKDIRKQKQNQSELVGTVAEYLGEVKDPCTDQIIARIATCHWKKKFNQIREYESSISTVDLMELERVVYSPDFSASIDPVGCVDVDDAISIKLDGPVNGLCEVGIHIADPTSYLIEGSLLDIELLNRSESVYLEKTIHMFPEELATKVFSLDSARLSRAFSIIFDVQFEPEFVISNVRIQKTLINLTTNMSYEEFDLSHAGGPERAKLYEIGRQLYRKLVGEDSDYDSKKMVQAYMIYANSIAAETIVKSCVNAGMAILRSQPRSKYSIDSIENANLKLIQIHSQLKYDRAILKLYSGQTDADLHSGVDLNLYTHFTSPIRRYSDIIVHRLLWSAVSGTDSTFGESMDDVLRTLFILNHNKRFYRKIVEFEKQWMLYDCITSSGGDTRTFEFEATVIDIDNLNHRVTVLLDRLYPEDHEMLTDVSPLNKLIGTVQSVSIINQKMIDSLLARSTREAADLINYEIRSDTVVSAQIDEDLLVSSSTISDFRIIKLFSKIKVAVTFVNYLAMRKIIVHFV